jgi:hypothetical protein
MPRWRRGRSVLADLQGAYFHRTEEAIHVYPLFGREHVISRDCWCCPQEEHEGVLVHNVEH